MREVDDHWPAEGAQLHHSVGIWPALIDDQTQVLESVPDQLLRLEAQGWPIGEAEVTIRLRPSGAGTEVEIEEDVASGPGRLLPSPLRQPILKWRNTETLRRLGYIAERRVNDHRGVPLMRALTWQGKRDVRVEDVPDPRIEQPNDAVIKVTSTAICGSDLHLYEVLGPFLQPGDVLGHEPMGVVVEVGPEAGDLQVGDRVVVPFNISCGHCWMCTRGLMAQCETTQVREQGKGATLFGYTVAVRLGARAARRSTSASRRPSSGPSKVPEGVPDERYLYLSDILPTAWQAVRVRRRRGGRHPRRPRARPGRPAGRPHRHACRAAA